MTWGDWTQSVLALMAWREARNQGRDGMRAVMHVARNRAISDKRDLAAVIVADAQFSSINPPKDQYDPQLDEWPASNDPIFRDSMQLASEVMAGLDPDLTNGAYYYWNPKTSKADSWFARNIANTPLNPQPHQLLATLGEHDFYSKEKKI